MMSDPTPTDEQIEALAREIGGWNKAAWPRLAPSQRAALIARTRDVLATPEFQAILRSIRAETLRTFAEYVEGGTPAAWGYHHPCDPPGVRWDPTPEQAEALVIVRMARESADRIEKEGDQR